MRIIHGLIAAFLFLASAGDARAQSLRGGKAAMTRQNAAADADGLTRLQDLDDLKRFIGQGHLVPIGNTRSYYLDGPGSMDRTHAKYYRYARPWTKAFMDKELGALRAKFGRKAKVTSLVRTQDYQDRICRAGNRAATCGDEDWEISTHLTGATVDISKHGMSRKALRWFRSRLKKLHRQGKVDVIEERGAFHVLVLKAYDAEPKKAKKAKKADRPKKAKKAKKRRRTR